ncbi:hypothetical protein ACJX0J_009097, partial [Zea mays]
QVNAEDTADAKPETHAQGGERAVGIWMYHWKLDREALMNPTRDLVLVMQLPIAPSFICRASFSALWKQVHDQQIQASVLDHHHH